MGPLPQRFRQADPRAGMTLVELLLALSIAVLVVGLLYAIYFTVQRAGDTQRERGQRREPLAALVDQVREDFRAALRPEADPACGIRLAPDATAPEQFSSLVFCRMAWPPAEQDAAWAEARQVRYTAHGRGAERMLVRDERPLTGPGSMLPPQSNTMIQALASFRVELFDGTTWWSQWPIEDEDARAQAARVVLVTDQEPTTFECFIPTGNTVGSEPDRRTNDTEAAGSAR